MEVRKYLSVKEIDSMWDLFTTSVYQKIRFLSHLEQFNPCHQRYYVAHGQSKEIIAGAIVYSLNINLFTFNKYSFPISISVIGLPASVDASGVVGKDSACMKLLIHKILQEEKGLVLCLNHNDIDEIQDIVIMDTLPTLIFEKRNSTWIDFLTNIKYGYRRRIIKATNKVKSIEKRAESCSAFTQEHYRQYLAVMARSKTTLETLSFDFFYHLPETYQLFSLYQIGRAHV